MTLEWLMFTILSVFGYSWIDLLEKRLLATRIDSALLLAILLAIFYIPHLAIIPIIWQIELDPYIIIISFITGVGMSFGYLLFIRSLILEELSRVTILSYIHPIFVVILAYIFLNETLQRLDYLAIGMLIASTILISYNRAKISNVLIPMLGLNLALAIESIIAKYLLTFTDYWSYIFWFMLGLISMRLSLLLSKGVRSRVKALILDRRVVIYCSAISILFLVGNLAFYYALSLQLASLVIAVASTHPIIILLLIYIINKVREEFVKEKLSYRSLTHKIISAMLVILGIYILTL